jgi:hypothetical protein
VEEEETIWIEREDLQQCKNAHRIREINEGDLKKRRKEEDDLESLRNINEENKD